MKDLILKYASVAFQNLAISIYNTYLYQKRHKGYYAQYQEYYNRFDVATLAEIVAEADNRLAEFLDFSSRNSVWYSKYNAKSLQDFPILEKIDLLNNLEKICTIPEKNGMVSLTGGTTGASMKVIYTYKDMQERFALLDHFRESYGYTLGKKTAWFSGKGLVRPKDLARGNCFRDDYINKIRFFSTFHISQQHFAAYWQAFVDFSPEFMVGFPSSVYDLCSMALALNLEFKGSVKAFFPTAETVLPHHREVITKVLGCQVVDQYASSEGAPFILQCKQGSLHIHPLTGVFEVVDEYMQPADEGEILVTSFTTHGTPLIRYRIGDRVKLAPKSFVCPCDSCFPVVEYIDGRTSDFIWSPENGRVNLGNISNCTKNVAGILCFQVIQDTETAILIKVVGNQNFDTEQEAIFLSALRQRVGDSMKIQIKRVDNIPPEKSGKFRIVKNSLKLT